MARFSRLRKFFDRFSVEIDALVKYYEMDDEDADAETLG